MRGKEVGPYAEARRWVLKAFSRGPHRAYSTIGPGGANAPRPSSPNRKRRVNVRSIPEKRPPCSLGRPRRKRRAVARRWFPLFCLATALPVGPSAAAPPTPAPGSGARAGIAAAYDQINAAYRRRDLGRVMSFFLPNYVETDAGGTARDRDQIRQQYQDWLKKIRTMRCRYVIQDLVATGDGDRVDMKMHTDGTGEKRVLFTRLRGTFTNDLVVRDLWVDTPEGWRLKRRQTLLDQTRIRPG